ncbi:iron uptake system component EfeO [Fictibacillus solisalsi]|uniref:Iron uptake system component EfeO n=1 Tax=Fictibacillus solisalsi TaxID=459525 RepID=A0A1G9WJ06_9BACL|nr:iron uptake system protein EfeO [Fictibacillus solisalsi]SDM84518.1 iron uptake system component EfeO [Fictibacillus solisalsi]
MNLSKSILYTVLSVSILTVPVVSGCSNKAASSGEQKKETSSKDNELKSQVKEMEASLENLQNSLQDKNESKVKEYGKRLNKQWLTYENNIREKYPLLYTDTEKYLLPLYAEVTKDKLNSSKVQQLSVDLSRSFKNLRNAKESTQKTNKVLDSAVKKYQKYVNEQTGELVKSTKSFTDAVRANNTPKAKEAYAEARVYYERIEPIAESFGDLDPKIDARENDVDGEWTGFHRIEKALWKDGSLKGMTRYANQLDQDVAELQEKIEKVKLNPTQIVAGSMELLNEAAISKVTGEEERYSHIDLVDLNSNVEGSQAVYHAVLPVLNEKNKDLAQDLDTEFNKITVLLNEHKNSGAYLNYEKLKKSQVRELSQQLNTLSESMAQTAEIFQ